MPRWVMVLIGVGVLIALVVVAVPLFLRSAIGSSTGVVTDVSLYASIRSHLDAAAHFPVAAPANAAGVKMVYWPGMMQGSSHLELRFEVTPAEAQAMIAKLPSAALMPPLVSECALAFTLVTLQEPGYNAPHIRDFPTKYQIFVLHDSKNWNHPNFGGVMIDPKSGEIIYFAEH